MRELAANARSEGQNEQNQIIYSEQNRSWQQIFNDSMTDIGRSISNSDATKKLHELGAYLQENPGVAFTIGAGGGALIAASPFIISTAPAIIWTDKSKDAAVGALMGATSYVATTDSNERTLSGYAYSIGTGVGTSLLLSPLTGAKILGSPITTTKRAIGGFAGGAGVDGISQLAQNDWDLNKVNKTKMLISGTMTSFSLILGGIQADKLIKPTYSETYGLGNAVIFAPKVSIDYMTDHLQKGNEKKVDK